MALLLGRRLFANRLLQKIQRRHGYIVLVPEIGEDSLETNPLLQEDGLPQFNNVTIENCMAAIGKQTLEFEADVKKIETFLENTDGADVFSTVIKPLERMGSNLDMTWGISKTLYLGNSSLMPTKSYLAIHDRAKRARATKYNSPNIFKVAQHGLDNDDLNMEEQRVLLKYTLEGRLNGLHLSDNKRALLHLNLKKIIMERMKFKSKIDAVTKKFNYKITDPLIMKSFPEDVKRNMSVVENKGPWMLTLQPHISGPFLEHCPDRDMRFNLWAGLVSRGSGYGDKSYETSTHIEEIRFLRRDQAKILGYDNFTDISMQTKMAGSVNNIQNTFDVLLIHAKKAQDREIASLYEFAVNSGFQGSRIEMWDYDYWRRKQCISLYDYDAAKLREYFPLQKVLNGIFELCEQLFSIKIVQRSNISSWHKDVKYYDVFELHSDKPCAGFYLDPYARSDMKFTSIQNNGWMVCVQNHSIIAGTKPLSSLVFNFQPPSQEAPSLLTIKELHILFHKFGQMLQHVMSRTTYSEVSGLSNVEWDAVDISGHFFSAWLYNKTTIDKISSHYQSGDKLPSHMFETMVNVRKHGAGTELCKELYLSMLDLEVHTSKDFWLDIVKELWPQYRSFPLEKIDSHPCSFMQIFCEEWAAAYYSHLWSKMIAADVYSAFHEVQDNEKEVLNVGKRFRDTFLALGGSCHPNQVFRNFRGRDPSPKALLATLSLKPTRK